MATTLKASVNKEFQTSLNFVDTQVLNKSVMSSKFNNYKQSKKGFKIQISSFESFSPFTLSVYFRKSNARFKVSLRHNQSFRENINHSFNVEPKVIQLIPN
jgi:hypothetical protein